MSKFVELETRPVDVDYDDPSVAQQISHHLQAQSKITTVASVERLKALLRQCQQGDGFVLQGGDCAELFEECSAQLVSHKVAFAQQLAQTLTIPNLINVGRIAGQFAKPRTQSFQTQNDTALPSYFGDIYNAHPFNEDCRTLDPQRLQHAYEHARKVYDFVQQSRSPNFEYFTSHELLNLWYERALSEQHDGQLYNLSTDFPWLGLRTLKNSSEPIEFARRISNPIALKINHEVPQLIDCIRYLNPHNEPGKIVLVHRLGAAQVAQLLPPLIESVQRAQLSVLWMCDPMHGNTQFTASGIKTRYVDDIVSEITQSLAIHAHNHSRLQGVHLEFSPLEVTECVGLNVSEAQLTDNYRSAVDPRLNATQTLSVLTQLNLALGLHE